MKNCIVYFRLLKMKVMKYITIALFFSSLNASWVLPPGHFLREFAIKHDRASITVYLPSRDASRKLIRDNLKTVTDDESKGLKL